MIRGDTRRVKTTSRVEAAIVGERELSIASTWSCAKSLWFLRPTDELLSFGSGASEPRGPTGVMKISSLRCWEPLSADKRSLTSVFRITI